MKTVFSVKNNTSDIPPEVLSEILKKLDSTLHWLKGSAEFSGEEEINQKMGKMQALVKCWLSMDDSDKVLSHKQ